MSNLHLDFVVENRQDTLGVNGLTDWFKFASARDIMHRLQVTFFTIKSYNTFNLSLIWVYSWKVNDRTTQYLLEWLRFVGRTVCVRYGLELS